MIPLVDLKRLHAPLRSELEEALSVALDSDRYILGPETRAFESEFAAFLGCHDVVCCGSGSDALVLAIMALELPSGSAIATVPNTFLATAESICRAGHRPVFVDVDPNTALMTGEGLRQGLKVAAGEGMQVSAVIPVHLYGQPVDLTAIREVAAEEGLAIIEDAAQAHGARWNGVRIGAGPSMCTFSFYPGKNLGALGDGGAVACSTVAQASRLRLLRNHGMDHPHHQLEIGLNSRFDAPHAAVLSVKLPHLDAWNSERMAAAARYDTLLASAAPWAEPMVVREGVESAHHLYVIRVPSEHRNQLLQGLRARGVGAQVHYPYALHLLPAYRHLGYGEGTFPVAEHLASSILSLPLFPGITESEQLTVVDALACLAEELL